MKILRYLTLIGGLVMLLIAIGFVFQNPIAIKLWPWSDGRYSYLFIGSILAAAGAAMLWVGWTGELGVLPAGSLNILVIAAMTSVYFFQLAFQEDRPALIPFGIASLLTAIASGTSFLMSRGLPFSDPRPTPLLVRISFAIFIISLLAECPRSIIKLPGIRSGPDHPIPVLVQYGEAGTSGEPGCLCGSSYL